MTRTSPLKTSSKGDRGKLLGPCRDPQGMRPPSLQAGEQPLGEGHRLVRSFHDRILKLSRRAESMHHGSQMPSSHGLLQLSLLRSVAKE